VKEQEAIKPSAFALGVYLKLSFIIRFYFNICDSYVCVDSIYLMQNIHKQNADSLPAIGRLACPWQ
jgi:hypothetical protein